ncbi:hypothetical protein GQ55_8G054500 [Panicum hallii var. hallii]|uniref:Uncharacterized protein n=1 Tax=Panicum hallii var. hallii TaxID=1504633 RepID=A0A2T7CKZ8_9POAL|nr:hypothetical protein GQ55_8G054500 [Panicum hallii var. hallii]
MPLQEDDRGRLIVARFRWLQEIVGDQIHAALAAVLEKIPQDSEVVLAVLDVSLDLNLNEGCGSRMNTLAFALVEHLKAVTARYCAPSGELLQTRCCICSVSCYCPVPAVPVNAGKTILQIREHLKLLVLWIHGLLRLRI